MNKIELSFEFLEKYLPYTKTKYIQTYLYMKYLYAKSGVMPSISQLSSQLDVDENTLMHRMKYWVAQGELVEVGDEYAFSDTQKTPQNSATVPETKQVTTKQEVPKKEPQKSQPKKQERMRPSYSSAEIDAVMKNNNELASMFDNAETILGHLLSGNDMELLYSFHDWLGLPCDVIVMMLYYAQKRGKTGKRYLETLAINWVDNGIDNYEKAEAYIKQLEQYDNNEHKIRSILGIYDRALSQTEKKYITQWTNQQNINPDLVSLAYDKTIENTGKLSWAYMNKILQSWNDEGIKNIDGVKRSDEIHNLSNAKIYSKNKANKTQDKSKNKFNNYEDTNKDDYDSLERKLLDMMIDN